MAKAQRLMSQASGLLLSALILVQLLGPVLLPHSMSLAIGASLLFLLLGSAPLYRRWPWWHGLHSAPRMAAWLPLLIYLIALPRPPGLAGLYVLWLIAALLLVLPLESLRLWRALQAHKGSSGRVE